MTISRPLVYAVLEIRVPFSPKLVTHDSANRLSGLLTNLPVLRKEQRQRVTQSDGGVSVTAEQGWRLLNRESTHSLVVTDSTIIYETTRYPGFEKFQSEVRECLEAVAEVAAPVGYDRLGLRYVNEIRPEKPVASFSEWEDFISPNLVTSLTELEATVTGGCVSADTPCELGSVESTLVFALPENSALTLRLANLDGQGIVGNAPLRRYEVPSPSPFFVVDFDAYWPRTSTDIRAFEVDDVVDLMDRVHTPVKSAFNWATTENYREEAGVANQ